MSFRSLLPVPKTYLVEFHNKPEQVDIDWLKGLGFTIESIIVKTVIIEVGNPGIVPPPHGSHPIDLVKKDARILAVEPSQQMKAL